METMIVQAMVRAMASAGFSPTSSWFRQYTESGLPAGDPRLVKSADIPGKGPADTEQEMQQR